MSLTDQEEERLAGLDRHLQDRLGMVAEDEFEYPVEFPEDWLDEWRNHIAGDNDETFERRLEIAGLSIDDCRRRLTSHGWPEDRPLPAWVETIDELLCYVERDGPHSFDADPIGEDEVPFAHVLTVIVEYASEQVDWTTEARHLSKRAVKSLERWLLDRLDFLFSHTLFIEFKTYLASHDRDLAFAEDPRMPESPRQYYDSFVETLLDGELKSIFLEYAVLSRATVTLVQQWTGAVEEFCSRLITDWDRLGETFGSNGELGIIVDIEILGDPHQNGRQVLGLTCESGLKIAYKPRGIGPETRFNDLLTWTNRRSTLPDLSTLSCVSQDGYGWVEWVDAEECDSTEEVARYYYRSGMLLCILYALNFTDGHLENIIAVGEQPIVVDLETLLHPDPPVETMPTFDELTASAHETVLRTQILPVQSSEDGASVGGLGETEVELGGLEVPTFENVNTDVMDLKHRDTVTVQGQSLPRVDGDRIGPEEYADDLADGFERMYRFLIDHREEVLASGGPIDAFEDVECRYLHRQTHTYRKVLTVLSTPSYLRTGLQFGCKVEELATPFVADQKYEVAWDIYGMERSALWKLDIPRFTVNATETSLRYDDSVIEGIFERSPLEQVRRRINSFNESDLDEQLDFITLAYEPQKLSHPDPPTVEGRPAGAVSDRAVIEDHARQVFERLRANARRTHSGPLTWYLREYNVGATENAGGLSYHGIVDDLYGGRLGVGLFVAALADTFGDEGYREFTADVVSPVLDELTEDEPFAAEKIGGGHGVGSLVYGFTKIAQLLDEDRYLDAARRTSKTLTTDRIESDTVFDIIGGSAGSILGLLTLYDETGECDALRRAVIAAEHLLANRTEFKGDQVWLTIDDDQPQTGFSHGISGIAYALSRLTEATGEDRFRVAALDSLSFERKRYSPERQNWPDLRPRTESDFIAGWCTGRAGIGLSRLGMLEMTEEQSLRRDVDRALSGVDAEALVERDHLCCGNFGRVELLLRAGRTFDEPMYRERARRLATATARRAEQAGRFTVPWQTSDWYNPSFFGGEAGIGYSLLRLVNPELPCVLLWE